MQEWLKTSCRAGTAREVAGNNPLNLDDPEKVWMVTAGHVDLFAVPCEEGHGLGERIHVHRVHPGEVLLGIAHDESTSLRLMAVGPPGTRVHELSHSRFSGIEDHSTELAALLDRWIDGLTAGVSRGSPAGRVSLLAAEEEGLHRAGRSVTPTQGVFWISGSELNGEWLGQIELSLSEEALFPLAGSGWLDISQATKLRAVRTSSLVPDDRLWTGLAGFHRATLSCIALNLQEAERAEAERLVQKSHSDDRLAQSTLARLAATVEPERSEAELALEHEAPILAACRLVGERLGMEIRAPRDFARKTWSDPVSAIARASELRIRRVTLRGPWWCQDGGPLLGFRGDTQQPTALLPTSATSYEMVDPATGTRVPVTQAIASELGSFGYCFFRSFPPHALTSRDVFQFALAGTRRDWGTVALLGLAGGLLGMLIPIGTGILFGRIIPASDHGQLMWLVLALAVTAVVMTLFEFVQGVASVRLETRMNASVEVGVWDRLLNLPTSFFRQYSTGDLAMRSMGIARIRQIVTEAAMSSVLAFVFSLVSFLLLFYLDFRLALIAALLFVIVASVNGWAAVVQLRYERENYRVRGKVSSIVLQLLTGISRLRVAGAEKRALAFWAKSYSQQTKLAYRAQLVANNASVFMAVLPLLSSGLIFGAVALMGSTKLNLATFLAFNAAFVQIIAASVTVSSTVTSLLDIIPLYERAKPILVTEPEFRRDKCDPGDLRGEIEISHVSFRYHADGPLILDDVNLHLQPGEFVALVGPSGAGKSTILRLLLGFEVPSTGSVYFDREDLTGMDQQAVRKQTGVVLQNSQLMPGTLLSNIIGSTQRTLEDAWEAARLSGLDTDIAEMPMGMYTVITEGESTLSGGQRQRLLIARALVSKPKILLFDEATSALDNVTQAKVAESLDELKATRVVVAHRLSTVINADRICVVEQGRIVQQGCYCDLIEQPGLFADLARRQMV